MFKISIDQGRCRGCGLCVNICGKVFQYATKGPEKIGIREEYRAEDPVTGLVPENVSCVKRAARACLVDAISSERCKKPSFKNKS